MCSPGVTDQRPSGSIPQMAPDDLAPARELAWLHIARLPALCECRSTQNQVFKKLEELTKVIRDASGLGHDTRTIDLACNGAISLKSHARDNTSKPDCYAIRYPEAQRRLVKDKVGKDQPLWLDVAVPGEFKKDDTASNFVDVRCGVST